MVALSSIMSIIRLNVKGINMLLKMQRLLEWMTKTRSNSKPYTEMNLKYKVTDLNKVGGKSYIKSKQKKSGEAILI